MTRFHSWENNYTQPTYNGDCQLTIKSLELNKAYFVVLPRTGICTVLFLSLFNLGKEKTNFPGIHVAAALN